MADEMVALQTVERVLASLRLLADPGDGAIGRLVESIEQDRAQLLALLIGAQAVHRAPARAHCPVGLD